MKFLFRIKRRPARPQDAFYRSTILSDKNAWKDRIKLFHLPAQSNDRIWKVVLKSLRGVFSPLTIIFGPPTIIFGPPTIILLSLLFWRIFAGADVIWIDDLLGTSGLEGAAATTVKRETIKALAQALFGLALILGIYVAYRRARALEETAKAQQETAKAQQQTAQAQHDANEQKMFNEATAKLGDESTNIRLGGIYALDTLARSNETYLTSIVEILCTHLRETAQQGKDEGEDKKKDIEEGKKEDEKRGKEKYAEKYKDKPSNEVQSLLRILIGLNKLSEAKQKDKQFNPVRLNLSGAYLVGTNLEEACLNRADLSRTDMRETYLSRAQLQKANLENAQMQGASLDHAQMQGASLNRAQMQGARLGGAQMQRASLNRAQMQGARLGEAQMQGASLLGAQMQMASLSHAQMQGAELWGAQMQMVSLSHAQMQGAGLRKTQLQGANLRQTEMQGAILDRTQLQGAKLREAQLQGAKLSGVDLRGAYVPSSIEPLYLSARIRERQNKQTDLTTVIFKGGLKQENARRIREQLIEYQKNGWMTKEEVAKINKILGEHQGKPINKPLPRGIKTGSYGKKEADAIIAEYEKATAGVMENLFVDRLKNTIIVTEASSN